MPRQTGTNLPPQAEQRGKMGNKPKEGELVGRARLGSNSPREHICQLTVSNTNRRLNSQPLPWAHPSAWSHWTSSKVSAKLGLSLACYSSPSPNSYYTGRSFMAEQKGKGEGGRKGKFIRWNANWITSHCPLNTLSLLAVVSRLLCAQGQQATGVQSYGA